MNKLIFSVLILFLANLGTAQVSFEQNPFEKADPFQYQSVRNNFWQQVDNFLAKEEYENVINLAFGEEIKSLKPNEKAEVYLAIAEAANKTNHPYLAFVLSHEITKIFPLSNQAIRSYFLIEDILKKNAISDELIIGETVIEQDINFDSKKIPYELKSFLGFCICVRLERVPAH